MIAAGAKLLAIEVGKTMISSPEETICLAEETKICIIGIPASGAITDGSQVLPLALEIFCALGINGLMLAPFPD
jgi:hypothetical protein